MATETTKQTACEDIESSNSANNMQQGRDLLERVLSCAHIMGLTRHKMSDGDEGARCSE